MNRIVQIKEKSVRYYFKGNVYVVSKTGRCGKKTHLTFSDNMIVIPTNPTPKRATREVANLDPTTVVGNNGSPARNTRAKFAVAAAALAATASNSQADAKQRDHKKHTHMAHKLEQGGAKLQRCQGDAHRVGQRVNIKDLGLT